MTTIATDRTTLQGGDDAPAASAAYVSAVLERLGGSRLPAVVSPYGSWSGRRFVADVHSTIDTLHQRGVGSGDVVAILAAPNHPALLTARYAAHWLGAAVVHLRSMNPRTDDDELPIEVQSAVLETAGATVLISDDVCRARATLLAASRPGLLLLGHDEAPERGHSPAPAARPEDCAVIDFTSGTTNAPRLVSQSFAARDRLLTHLLADAGSEPRTFVSVTPISHTTAPSVDATLMQGGTVLLHEGFAADAVLDAIEAGATDLYLAVPHLYALLDHPRTAETDLSRLRRVVYSGTPAAPARMRAALAVFGTALVQVYGTTETGGICALTSLDHQEPELLGAVGRPFPWVQVSLRDPDSGAVVSQGEVGAVWVRSDTLADGYVGDDHATSTAVREGWFATGDLGWLDRYGYLRLVGRVGGVIKCGGIKIYPTAIEQALHTHPAVREAVVQGTRDAERREHVHAVVVLQPGANASDVDLAQHVTQVLSPLHAPTKVVFWSGLPLTRSGKPDHRLIRQILGE